MILMGSFCEMMVIRSPMSMERPPSPQKAMTCRFGNASCAPIASGIALAIVP
jgi:hypothetical protein